MSSGTQYDVKQERNNRQQKNGIKNMMRKSAELLSLPMKR